MKLWAWIVAFLYAVVLVVLTVPVLMLALKVDKGLSAFLEVYTAWQYWVWIAIMLLCQAALLTVPVRVASRRPVTRRGLWLPVITAGLMMGGLVIGAMFSLFELIFHDHGPAWFGWAAPACGAAVWAAWSIAFFRSSRQIGPADVVSRQCRLMLQGSILELLIAVPTHIVARSREYCCAGFMTFLGLTMGISVMLFSFGPAVFFLYADRWRKTHPQPSPAAGGDPG